MRPEENDRPPIGRFEEEVDPIGVAKMVAAKYATMENGYHAQLRAFLQKAYHSYQLFCEYPDEFEKLKRAPFWKASRQRPKDLTTSRWVLLIIMQAKTSNVRVRASKYAKILDHFARAEIKVPQVANRIKKFGGVEAAYKRMVAIEQRRCQASAHGGMEEERPIHRQQESHASRKGGATVHCERVEAETGSGSAMDIDIAVGSRRPMPSSRPMRLLTVELEAPEFKRVLDAGAKAKRPVRFRLDITVHPHNGNGFPRVVGNRVSSIADVVEDSLFDPQPDRMPIDRTKAPLRSSVAGGGRERAPGVSKPGRNPWAGRKPSSPLRRRGTGAS
jgi:hypothetical protein